MVKIPIEACNEDGEQVRSFHIGDKEYPDSRPMEIPVGASKPESLIDMMRRMVRTELSDAAQEAGMETFEEAGDYDIDDDPMDPLTPWEALFEVPIKASEKGEANVEVAPPTPSQTSSSGSVSALSTPTSVQTAKPVGQAADGSVPSTAPKPTS